ncbi:MAG: cysteine synthase A [Candidatus Eisenbacteria bacterium]|nr:cysteine synthase A [Candidatus Eisenbacteria bacterium]
MTAVVGGTPLVRLRRLAPHGVTILAKLESMNPLGSVKDRVAVAMIERAEREGRLSPGSTIVEPTSGNTGVGLAFAGASRGYRVILVMPAGASRERRQLLAALGAQLVLVDGGMSAAVDRTHEILERTGDAIFLNQFGNPANPAAHEAATGPEIWNDTEGDLDAFVAGVGTGGTITGVGRYLKERRPDVTVVAVEPAASPVLSGGRPGSHGIQGIGAGFVPEVVDRSLIDRVVTVTDEEAAAMTRRLAREEGILAGISSGAALAAAFSVASPGERVVVVLPDGGLRYLSTGLFDERSATDD